MAQKKYNFGSNDLPISSQKRQLHRRQTSKSSVGSEDHSLSYSATSSVQSSSTTGESTDSSFAEIYKVLDSAEGEGKLTEVLKTERNEEVTPGQPSDSRGHDGGGSNHGGGSALFVPADSHRTTPSRTSPKTKQKGSTGNTATVVHNASTNRKTTSGPSPGQKGKAEKNKPPQGPIKKNDGKQIWYSQMWMCGFADAFNFSGDS